MLRTVQFMCTIILVLLTISASQVERNFPSVREVVTVATELGLLQQGQCPLSASGSGEEPASAFPSGLSGSGVSGSGLSASGVSASGAVSASGVSASGAVSGSGVSASGAVSGSGVSASGAVSGSGVSTSGVSASGMSGSGVSGSGVSASGVSTSGVSGSGVSTSGVSASAMSGSGVSGSGVSASGVSASGVSGSGLSGSGVSASGMSGSGVSGSGVSASGVSASGVSASGMSGSGLSGSGVSASGVSGSGGLSASGISESGVSASASALSASALSASGVSASGASASGVSASGVSASSVSASGVSASGVSASGVSASGSGSGGICPDTFQIFGPLCATAMQVRLCSFNFSSETCDMCNTLLSLCGPFEGNTSTLCASEIANSCLQTPHTCFNVQTVDPMTCDLCAFVGSVCFQGREFELCPVEGLVDGCTSVLSRSPFVCECFLPSFQCMFCRTLLDVCTATIPPNVVVDVSNLTLEQAENAVTIFFGNIIVLEFNNNELQFRQGIANIVNQNALISRQPVRERRQTASTQNVTASNVFIVGPSPFINMNGSLTVVFFVETNAGTVINGRNLTEAVQNQGPALAQEIGAQFIGSFNGLPSGFEMTPTIQTLSPTGAVQLPQPTGSVTILLPTETAVPTEPPEPTGQLSQGALAGIIVGAIVAAIAVLVIVSICVNLRRRRRKYTFATALQPNVYGTYVTDASRIHFGQLSRNTDQENLTSPYISMEERAGTRVETSQVIVNTTAAEPEEIQETHMGDENGREVQEGRSGQQDGNQVDNTSGEA